jgi:hypothetical protein
VFDIGVKMPEPRQYRFSDPDINPWYKKWMERDPGSRAWEDPIKMGLDEETAFAIRDLLGDLYTRAEWPMADLLEGTKGWRTRGDVEAERIVQQPPPQPTPNLLSAAPTPSTGDALIDSLVEIAGQSGERYRDQEEENRLRRY